LATLIINVVDIEENPCSGEEVECLVGRTENVFGPVKTDDKGQARFDIGGQTGYFIVRLNGVPIRKRLIILDGRNYRITKS